jgi:transketolase
MQKLSNPELVKIAREVRRDIIKMIAVSGSGHPGGSLGATDILVALYFNLMNHDPAKPDWSDRDRFILSNGHICPALYSVMARAGYFSVDRLKTLRQLGSPLQGHPERQRLPGIETTSGPLGSGLAQAAGMALAARMDGARCRIYCLTSDGEHQEGNHWEAVMFAAKNNLSNLTLLVDRNNIQTDDFVENVMPLEPLVEKYKAFNWHVIDIGGHNFQAIIDAVGEAKAVYENPTVIICHTIAGKGVSFMENKFEWHAKAPTEEEKERALKELRQE